MRNCYYDSFASVVCHAKGPKTFLDILINHVHICKMELCLEFHQVKLIGIDGPLTYKLRSYLCQGEVEMKSDLLDLAKFLPPV